MARNIAQKGRLAHPLTVYNRTAQRAHDFAASAAAANAAAAPSSAIHVAETIADAVAPADIVFTSLGDDASVRSTFDTILGSSAPPGGVRGKLFVETSTILPATTNEVAARVLAAGAEFIACPGACASLLYMLCSHVPGQRGRTQNAERQTNTERQTQTQTQTRKHTTHNTQAQVKLKLV